MKRLLLFHLSLLFSIMAFGENTTIKELNESPEKFNGEQVIISGLVNKWVPSSENSTSHYLLEDEFGFSIQVNTAAVPPETNVKYRISGIAYYDTKTQKAFISEQGRIKINGPAGTVNAKSKSGSSTVLLIIIIIVAAVILVFAYRMFFDKAGKKVKMASEQGLGLSNDMDDFQTIKIGAAEDSKTLIFIPGELKIIAGSDKGKVFKISGYPTPDGNVVSIGREAVAGERAYAHIRLLDNTISRKQAEIIQQGEVIELKNLSKTNLTVVDGIELQPNQKVALKPNSTIKIGEVEFQYIV